MRQWMRDAAYQVLHALSTGGSGVRVILLYHSVGGHDPRSIPVPVFDRQIQVLADRFRIVTLRDLCAAIAAAPPEAGLACVTFDDGYRDTYEHALPVLARRGIPATVFVATGFLGGTFPTRFGKRPMMTADQVRATVAMGHEIGAHTITHPRLTDVLPEAAQEEIASSKRSLEDLIGSPIESFAYPKGACSDPVKRLVAAAGFRSAVTTREGLVQAVPDWLALPRVRIGARLSVRGFDARLSPGVGLYARLRGVR